MVKRVVSLGTRLLSLVGPIMVGSPRGTGWRRIHFRVVLEPASSSGAWGLRE